MWIFILSISSESTIDQNFYTVENTREDTITDNSYFTQFEQEEPERFNVEETPIGEVNKKNKNEDIL